MSAGTFPAFTDDWVEQLENFMNAGGNLFISGQDIGWDISTGPPDGHATPASQDFYCQSQGAAVAFCGGFGATLAAEQVGAVGV